MGRTVTETARRVPGEHHLITTRAHDGGDAFASVHELGGRIETFPMSSADRLHELLAEIDPDVVHLHAGALGPLLAQRSGLGRYPLAPDDLRVAGPARSGGVEARRLEGAALEQRPARPGRSPPPPFRRRWSAVPCAR